MSKGIDDGSRTLLPRCKASAGDFYRIELAPLAHGSFGGFSPLGSANHYRNCSDPSAALTAVSDKFISKPLNNSLASFVTDVR